MQLLWDNIASKKGRELIILSIVLIRSLILYILVIISVRLMGKRQLGELQPSELVITILVSNIATLPIENLDIPLIVGMTPILSLVCFEVIVSWINLRFPKLRRAISGTPKIIIRGGKIDENVLKELRFSVDDLMMALRGSDIFNIEDVQYAIVETTGSLSVMKKQSIESPTRDDLNIRYRNNDPPQVVISDGEVISKALKPMGYDTEYLVRILKEQNLRISDVFIMTSDSCGNCYIADKKGSAPIIVNGGKQNDKD